MSEDSKSLAVEEPLRILEVEAFGRGGLAHYVNNLAGALASCGHRVTLVTAVDYELAGSTEPSANLKVEPLTARATGGAGESRTGFLPGWIRKIEAIHDAFAVARLAYRLAPDLIHLHTTNPIALLYLGLFRLLRRPIVYTAHVVTPHEQMRFEKPIYRGIHKLSHLIIAHSEFDRRRLLEEFSVEPERVAVIPHGEYGFFERHRQLPGKETARRALGIEPQEEVALFFGYIREYKGLDVLLTAWPAVAAARPGSRLLIAGDPVQLSPERRRELEAWATSLGAMHRFTYIPFSEVTQFFSAADVLVMPYRRISQSGVLFLALALGVPVVATRVGALPELLDDGESALLVSPESSAQLADALIRVLGDAELRAHLAGGGRRVAAQHSWLSIAQQTEAAFRRLARSYRLTT